MGDGSVVLGQAGVVEQSVGALWTDPLVATAALVALVLVFSYYLRVVRSG